MITLALGGWHSHGAAAVASSGRVLAAVDAGAVAGLRDAGLAAIPDAWAVATRCLVAGGVSWGDVQHVRLVVDTLATGRVAASATDVMALADARGLLTGEVTTVNADMATHALAQHLGAGSSVLYAGVRDAWMSTPTGLVSIAGYGALVEAAERLARALGLARAEPWQALQRLSEGHAPDARRLASMRPVLRAASASLLVSTDQLDGVLLQAAATVSVPLDRADSPHVGAQALRGALAAAWLSRVSEVLAESTGDTTHRLGGLVGSLPAIARHRLPDVLPCPDARAAVVGAALSPAEDALGRDGLPSRPLQLFQAIGERFSEADVKLALESSRLDYLYEPRPERLLDRVSALLASGKLVAWFDGRADLSDTPSGTRVVVADAADRYARDNINVYFRHRPVEDVLTVAVTAATAETLFGDRAPAAGQRARLAVPTAAMPHFEGATNRHGTVDLTVVDEVGAPGLHRLIVHHEARTGHPALVMSALATPGGAVATRPLEALGVTYTTPVDALVMGRFVVFKDYWLLRSGLPTA